ncbi:hypothetical protein JHK87_009832 [Glycine soja]|nr:hypothetical protein JHK87_009832 [Glycine soja]
MGKKQNDIQKTGLGRALLSRFYRKKFLESFNEVSDIDAVVEQSLEPLPKLAVVASTTLISLLSRDLTLAMNIAKILFYKIWAILSILSSFLARVGVLIGKAGDTIRYLQYNSSAKIQITRDADADPLCATRSVELIGILESIDKAEKLMNVADVGDSPSLVARGLSPAQATVGSEQIQIQVPNEKVGLIIGRSGETIKSLQTKSGVRIQLIPQHLSEGDDSKERTVQVTGDKRQIQIAQELIKEVMNQDELIRLYRDEDFMSLTVPNDQNKNFLPNQRGTPNASIDNDMGYTSSNLWVNSSSR